jgi:para-nitrobenzyl esterase
MKGVPVLSNKIHTKISKTPKTPLKYQLHFWIPYTFIFLFLILFAFLNQYTTTTWILLIFIILLTFLAKNKILGKKLILRLPIWLIISALSITAITLTKPPLINIEAVDSKNPEYTEAVPTKYGFVSGVYNSDKSVEVFAGIPYAAPPIGELRWKAPLEPATWKDVLKADHFSDCAMQNTIPTIISKLLYQSMGTDIMRHTSIEDNEKISEDCLYLNIWRNSDISANDKRPVIVYIHGGSYTTGSGSIDIYNGESMAKKGAIFITINYRLGIFGYYASPDLTAEADYGASGNYGILDQIAALQWIKANIAAFGGDPDNVTVAGESAGSFSVNILQASPLAKGLFQRVIGESGANFGSRGIKGRPMQTKAAAEKSDSELQDNLKKYSLKELRSVSASDLIKASRTIECRPIVDGYVLPDTVYNIYASGEENDVPALIGYNANESSIFISLPWPISLIPAYASLSADDFKLAVNGAYGNKSMDFFKAYPDNNQKQALESQLKSGTIQWFGWQMYTWSKLQSQSDRSKVYTYYFTHVQPGPSQMRKLGAFHGSEVAYAYGNLDKINLPYKAYDYELSDVMLSYWYNFAANGNPNGDGLPEWSAYDVNNKKTTMEFGDRIEMEATPNIDQMALFDDCESTLR